MHSLYFRARRIQAIEQCLLVATTTSTTTFPPGEEGECIYLSQYSRRYCCIRSSINRCCCCLLRKVSRHDSTGELTDHAKLLFRIYGHYRHDAMVLEYIPRGDDDDIKRFLRDTILPSSAITTAIHVYSVHTKESQRDVYLAAWGG